MKHLAFRAKIVFFKSDFNRPIHFLAAAIVSIMVFLHPRLASAEERAKMGPANNTPSEMQNQAPGSGKGNPVKRRWTKISDYSDSNGKVVTYLDTAHVRRVGDIVSSAVLMDWDPGFDAAPGVPAKSNIGFAKFDCVSARYLRLSSVAFDGSMGSGTHVLESSYDKSQQRWIDIDTDVGDVAKTLLLKVREAACRGSGSGEASVSNQPTQPTQPNPQTSPEESSILADNLERCNAQAAREVAEATTPTPIDPKSVLSPILLLNDLNRRKQQEANQPQVLQQIELERQQCRKNVVAAGLRRLQETMAQKADAAQGYKKISFKDFALDAKTLAAGEVRVTMQGAYVPDGNMDWFFESYEAALTATMPPLSSGANIQRIPLLTEDASRSFREQLLRCKTTPGSNHSGCQASITGHVSLCSMTSPMGSRSNIPCIVVENGRM